MTVKALDDPSLKLNEADVSAGSALYMACVACHGRNLISAGSPAPDLRESRVALNPDSLWTVLHDGTLLPNGMPRFEMFTRDQVGQLFAYIRAVAREALANDKSQGNTPLPAGRP